MIYHFYPKDRLENTLKGFNQIPIIRDQENPNMARVDLKLTPFSEYEKDVITISNPDFIDKSKVLELQSFVLMQCGDKWLKIDDAGTDRIGLLTNPVNRGLESQEISSNLGAIKLQESAGEKNLTIIGYILEDTRIVFLLRFKFDGLPQFMSKKRKFIELSNEVFFNIECYNNLQPFSKTVLEAIDDTLIDI